jgi:hypothetical protein
MRDECMAPVPKGMHEGEAGKSKKGRETGELTLQSPEWTVVFLLFDAPRLIFIDAIFPE